MKTGWEARKGKEEIRFFRLFSLAAVGIALIAAGCTRTQNVRYKNLAPPQISGNIQKDLKVGIAKFADLRSFVIGSDARSESFIDNKRKHALEFEGRDYYPVKDMIHKIFVGEFTKAGINAKPIDAVLSKDKKKDMHIIGKKNGVDYIIAGDIADFKFESVNDETHQRIVTLNIILVKVEGEATLFDATFADINKELNDDLDPEENAERLVNIPFRNVLKQVIQSTAAKLFPDPTSANASTALTPEEILLLKKAGVSDEKILEMHKKKGTALPQPALAPQPAPTVQPAAPAPPINAFDWNEDGKKDIITGSDSGHVYVYLNSGANPHPAFDKPVKIPGVKAQRLSDPYITDWNSDGKKDAIVGQASGEVSVFINTGTNKSPLFGDEIKLNDGRLDVGQYSSVSVVDWNADGKKDLLIGNSKGKLYIFLNMNKGDDSSPQFSEEDNGIETAIRVSGYATPVVVDWNNDGKFDVVCGSEDGRVYVFINEGSAKAPKFGKAQILQVNNKELKLPSPTSVIAMDWDNDGKMDFLVSNKKVVEQIGGRTEETPLGFFLLMNTGTKEKPEFKELKPVKGNFMDDAVL